MTFVVAFEGIDGSGKGTQSQWLAKRIRDCGTRVSQISFPRYESTTFGKAIGEYLDGRYGRLDQVPPFLAALLYAGDRFESLNVLRGAMADSDLVVLDRYVASNTAHQGAKATGAKREELIRRIESVEYDVYGLPRADLVLLLDIPVDQACRLIAKKSPRSYTDRETDLQESDIGYLEQVRQLYLELARGDHRWRTITCVRNGQLRTIDDLADEILADVNAARASSP